MRIVRAEDHRAVRVDHLQNLQQVLVLFGLLRRLARESDVVENVAARLALDPGNLAPELAPVLVHPPQQMRHPTVPELRSHYLQAGETHENPFEDHARDARHGYLGEDRVPLDVGAGDAPGEGDAGPEAALGAGGMDEYR